MTRPPLGEQELALLRYLTNNSPSSVSNAVDGFGQTHSLARTTILTMMERLRKKGYLERESIDGTYRYRASVTQTALLRTLISDFTTRILGGSIQPYVAYLAEDARLDEEEVAALRALVAKLDDTPERQA